jgi:putative glycosyltransferase (TIGR04372 family)
LHVRDSHYLKKRFPHENYDYHNYRDFDIDDFNEMINVLVQRGYHVVRMGRDVSKKIKIKNQKVIDYSNSKFISDFADIYLIANCKMLISTSSGLECVAKIFKKTIAQICIHINKMYTNSNIINGILTYECLREKRPLSLKEINERGVINLALSGRSFLDKDVKILKNNKIFYKNYANFCLDIVEEKIDQKKIFVEQTENRNKLKQIFLNKNKFNSIIFADNKNFFN